MRAALGDIVLDTTRLFASPSNLEKRLIRETTKYVKLVLVRRWILKLTLTSLLFVTRSSVGGGSGSGGGGGRGGNRSSGGGGGGGGCSSSSGSRCGCGYCGN